MLSKYIQNLELGRVVVVRSQENQAGDAFLGLLSASSHGPLFFSFGHDQGATLFLLLQASGHSVRILQEVCMLDLFPLSPISNSFSHPE